jgi:hypothetical protein
MKLGLIRIPEPRPAREEQTAVCHQLMLVENLGFDLAYLPKLAPHQIAPSRLSTKTSKIRVGLDAMAFGRRAPRDLEAAVLAMNSDLDGRLSLGVEMCGPKASTRCKAEAQNIETLFSDNPAWEYTPGGSRSAMEPDCPEILGLPVVGSAQETALAAARGYRALTPSWLPHRDVARHWPAVVVGATSALRRARPSHWQLARTIVVHDDPAMVHAYVYGARSPIRRYYSRLAKRGLISPGIDENLKHLVIAGTADQVAGKILALQEAVGEIGTLHCIDHPGSDPEMTRNTLVCLAEDVMPMLGNPSANKTKELERT